MGLETGSLFISYSRKDKDLLLPILELHVDVRNAAYLDETHTPLGKDWEAEHRKAIQNISHLILVWSKSSASSPHVEREWRTALEFRKRIIPVWLDDTPLPSELEHFHGLSLADYVSNIRDSSSLASHIRSDLITGMDAVPVLLVAATLTFVTAIVTVASLVAAIREGSIIAALGAVLFGFLLWIGVSFVTDRMRALKLQRRLERAVIEALKDWNRDRR